MILVIGFSFFCCFLSVKTKLSSVQRQVLFGFIGRKARVWFKSCAGIGGLRDLDLFSNGSSHLGYFS